MTILINNIEDLLLLDRVSVGEPLLIEFSPKTYNLPQITLPRTGHLVVVKGNGAIINFVGPENRGFSSQPMSQGQALNEFNSTRYHIENFSKIVGGDYAIDIGSTFNSVFKNMELVGQRKAGINLRFALMSRLENILVTNPFKDGIYLGDGNWSGATHSNSQSNHSVLDQCRVYAKEGGDASFRLEENSGIKMINCIAEGRQNKNALVYSVAKSNPVVKQFTLNNFHIEYNPSHSAIDFLAPAATSNNLEGIYFSSILQSPAIYNRINSPMNIRNIGWWSENLKIHCTHWNPAVVIERSHYTLRKSSFTTDDPRGMYGHNIFIKNPIKP